MKEKQQRVTEIHESLYSKSDNPGAIYELDGKKFVDLFPYKIRGRDRFYFRDHPKNIPPDSFEYRKYWGEFAKHCIEGKWIKDEAGTWVYMMPKLFYYINYVTIPDSKRRIIFPDLCDLEWIYFTYFLCIDGFSGFEDDDKYTCNYLIYRYNRSKDTNLSKIEREEYELDVIDMESIPDNCISKETGEYKEYVNPWEYLTRTYLIDDPRGPLGQPLYNNSRSNGIILGSRVCRKSFTTYLGDFNHEWTFGGVTRVENMKYCKNPLLFAMGAGTASQINRTLKNVRAFYDSQPGSYVNKINPDEPKYMGPFYKNYQGSLSTGKEFQHIVKDSQGKKVEIFGSTCQVSALTPDRTKLGAGDRFRRIYIEEVGFIPYIEDVINANEDSIKIGDEIVGSWIATGTSGDLEAIRGPKKIFENVKAYRVFGIPNYWKNMSKEIGFFIPTTYQDRKYEDSDGFVNIKLAAHNIMKQRAKKSKSSDSVKYLSHIMFNPVEPDEMLIPNTSSVLPKAEAMVRLSEIEEDNLDRLVKNVGTLEFDIKEPYGVRFDKDMEGKLNPIDYYVYDSKKIDSRGAFKMYESPPPIIPKNMYWVVYDPAAQDGEGTSNHALIVYKHRLSSDGRNWTDTDRKSVV